MFRFTRKPSSESHRQYLAKTTHLAQRGYIELVQDVSVMAAYYDLWGVCAVQTRLTGHNNNESHKGIHKAVDLIPALFEQAKSQTLYCFLFYFKCPAFVLWSVSGGVNKQTTNLIFVTKKLKSGQFTQCITGVSSASIVIPHT
jgi:hypothetical protein